MRRQSAPSGPVASHPPARAGAQDVLRGGGEMGALMRSIDWSQTALGPVESWPQSLRTTVSTCLNSRFPILIWWGPELVKIYNDAYRPMLGDKHPRSMGARGRDVWPEIWHIIGPMLEGVLERGEATWSVNEYLPLVRHGFVEECYFTYSYSPIRGEAGEGVVGVYCAVAETTTEVIHGRRLRTLHDLWRRTGQATTKREACRLAAEALGADPEDLPFVLLYLLEGDGSRARLVASSGLSDAGAARVPAGPIDLSDTSSAPWPLAHVARTGKAEHLRTLEDTAWEWLALEREPGAPTSALFVPMGRPSDVRPAGILVAGLSPHLAFDDRYRSFVELVASEAATAVYNARALHEAQERAESLAELDRAKTTFFSNVSHEFRTPLTLMIGPTEDALTASERTLSGDDLEMVYRNELRLLRLVNALLDFSRIEAGRAEASYEPTDLAALTADLASAFCSTIERGGLRFDVDCPPLSEPVYVDRDMWEKIVLNLLSNAFKYTFDGSIRVMLRAAGDHVELEVTDTGEGIPEPEQPRLFERFHRIRGIRSRAHEGSGIGLALVKSLVELHGGSIGVASAMEQGTTFTVSIPFGLAHLPAGRIRPPRTLTSTATRARSFVEEASRWLPEPSQDSPQLEDAAPASAVGLAPARVLVADDNADMRDYLARLLRQHWTVVTAADGAEALEAARRHPPDLVLADVMMPNLDGFELLRALRADEATADARVIMLSARAGDESRVEGMEAGADDYLVKPFSARELMARVSAQLITGQHAKERADLLMREQAARREADLQKEHLVSLFMQAPTPIVLLRGPQHVVELANPHTCRLWGRERDDIIGKPLLEALPELRSQPFVGLLDGVYRTGQSYVGKEAPARLDWHGDGTLTEVRLNFVYSPLRNLQGDVDGVLVMAFDVTDEVTARMRMSELRAEAEVANRAKDEFLAMLGHELRNPLAPILTALQLMRLRGGDELEKERLIIERQADQLVRLIDDLLDVSRITRGKVDLRRERVEMSEVVARAIETASPLIEQREHHLAVNVPHGLVVEGDSARLTQVVANLLMNAAKYTEQGGRVRVTGERDGDEIVVTVRDNGIGIAPDQLPKVFGMFTQARQSIERSSGGLGLGLAIVRSLVAMHGGSVGVHSEGKGHGSEFTVRLPAAIERRDAIDAAAATPAATDGEANGRRRILVVDDNIDAAESLAEFVEAIGHTPRVAHDGPAALRVAEEFDPEIALIDIGLPILDGHELARHMRERLDLRQVRLIAVTGYGQEADRDRTRRAGFDAHLVKPVDLTELRSLIESYVAEMP